MRRNNEKNKVYNTGRGITSQALLYQHMSNHYRRILNAKKAIDTTPPVTFKPKFNTAYSASSSPVRSFVSCNKKFITRNTSPALTERTGSSYSNGGSYWINESYCQRKDRRYSNDVCGCRGKSEINPDNSDMDLINQIAYDTKHGPANCFHSSWKNVGERPNYNEFRSPYEAKKTGSQNGTSGNIKKTNPYKSKFAAVKRKLPLKDKAPSDLMERHSKCFISHNNSFCPRILKTNATSKVKNLKVYHPPRKKSGKKGNSHSHWREVKEEAKVSVETAAMTSKCHGTASLCENKNRSKDCSCKQSVNPRETSQTSSRDSAYNGGVSSLPESRSPTPDQRKQKSCCCHAKVRDAYYNNVRNGNESIIVPNLKLTDNQDTQTEISHISARKNQSPKRREREDTCRTKQEIIEEEKSNCKSLSNDEERDSFKKKIKEEALYTNFIRDITAEVLEKGLYTNKALKKVMKRHVLSNLWLLDKDRMLKEIDKLRIQLGIPEDEDLMDIKLEPTASVGDVDDSYTVISDSELTEPSFCTKKVNHRKNSSITGGGKMHNNLSHTDVSDIDKPFPKSISDVLYNTDENNEITLGTDSDDEDDELISVIQVTKLVRDKKKHESLNKDLSATTSENATQGNSADESDQSSDHVCRKKKTHSRFRKAEIMSSSSDDRESSKRITENKRYLPAKVDNQLEGGTTGKLVGALKKKSVKRESNNNYTVTDDSRE